jgi:hypothetical protein
VTIKTAMLAAMIAYSMEVAPRSSPANRFKADRAAWE